MISPPKGFMSAENKEDENSSFQGFYHGRKEIQGFSIQEKNKDGFISAVSEGGSTPKPRLVVIKNEEEIVRPSSKPDVASSHGHNVDEWKGM